MLVSGTMALWTDCIKILPVLASGTVFFYGHWHQHFPVFTSGTSSIYKQLHQNFTRDCALSWTDCIKIHQYLFQGLCSFMDRLHQNFASACFKDCVLLWTDCIKILPVVGLGIGTGESTIKRQVERMRPTWTLDPWTLLDIL